MKTLNCFCCGAEITAPQFHNGKAYGWTCIKKVVPAAKQTKVKYVGADEFSITTVGNLKKLVAKVDGKKVVVPQTIASIRKEVPEFNLAVVADGVCMIAETLIK